MIHTSPEISSEIEQWPLLEPFRFAGYLWETLDVLKVSVGRDGFRGDEFDLARVIAARAARPDVWLGVEANRALTRASERLLPSLIEAGVALIEQPFTVGEEVLLDGLRSPIPIAADETVQSLADVPGLVGRFNVVNIKLDKCGGLTEVLAMARAVRDLGLEAMVGNMLGTSLAMAPAFLVGQLCSVVDLDGPVFLRSDRPRHLSYLDGFVSCQESVWGSVMVSSSL
jgi:L-alanine-DL-glutamate epimerase-like enolase superfamily enzyme